MKKIFTLAIAAVAAVSMNAQTVAELEAKQAEVQQQLANYDDGIAKKWEFRFDAAGEYGFGDETKNGREKVGFTKAEEAWFANVGVGYNLNSNLYLGVASGYWNKIGRCSLAESNCYIPLMGDITYRWNGEKEKWSFFIEGRGGYLFSTMGKTTLSNNVEYEYPNGWSLDIQPGVYYRIKRNIDLKFSLGYGFLQPFEDTPDKVQHTNMVQAKLGLNFRKAPKCPARSVLLAEAASLAEQIEAAKLAAEEAARQAALKAAQEEAARKAAAEAAARKAAEEEAARLAALEAAKHKELTLFYEIRLSDLTAEHNAQLDELVEWVNTRKIDKILVQGYADRETGNPRLNVGYAKNRAEKVKKALIKKYKINKNMIECSSYGDTVQPFGENIKNRCTIIVVNEVE